MNLNVTPTGIFVLVLVSLYLIVIILDLLFHFLGFAIYIAFGQIILCVIVIILVLSMFKRKL